MGQALHLEDADAPNWETMGGLEVSASESLMAAIGAVDAFNAAIAQISLQTSMAIDAITIAHTTAISGGTFPTLIPVAEGTQGPAEMGAITVIGIVQAHQEAIMGSNTVGGSLNLQGIVSAHKEAINGSEVTGGNLELKGIVPAHQEAVGINSKDGKVESIYAAHKGAIGKGEWHGELGIEGYRDATLKKIDGSIQYLADDIFGRVMARLGLSGEPQRDPKFDGSGNSAV